jgi:hypothetical protein
MASAPGAAGAAALAGVLPTEELKSAFMLYVLLPPAVLGTLALRSESAREFCHSRLVMSGMGAATFFFRRAGARSSSGGGGAASASCGDRSGAALRCSRGGASGGGFAGVVWMGAAACGAFAACGRLGARRLGGAGWPRSSAESEKPPSPAFGDTPALGFPGGRCMGGRSGGPPGCSARVWLLPCGGLAVAGDAALLGPLPTMVLPPGSSSFIVWPIMAMRCLMPASPPGIASPCSSRSGWGGGLCGGTWDAPLRAVPWGRDFLGPAIHEKQPKDAILLCSSQAAGVCPPSAVCYDQPPVDEPGRCLLARPCHPPVL